MQELNLILHLFKNWQGTLIISPRTRLGQLSLLPLYNQALSESAVCRQQRVLSQQVALKKHGINSQYLANSHGFRGGYKEFAFESALNSQIFYILFDAVQKASVLINLKSVQHVNISEEIRFI